MDSIYYTDDYNIDGCTLKIESLENMPERFIISVQAPKAQGYTPLEMYYPMNIDETVEAISCLLKRKPVPAKRFKTPQS